MPQDTFAGQVSPAVIKARPEAGGLALTPMPLGPIGPRDVLVRVHYAAICGTDLHLYKWNGWAARTYRPPFPLGHELGGEVVEIGAEVTAVAPGDIVSAETHIYCGTCSQCRANRRHTCLNLKVFSKLGQGCFRRHTVVPERALRKVPATIGARRAAIMEPLGVSIRVLMETDIRAATVLIVGCGPIGLFAVAGAAALGAARILAVDPVPFRRELAGAVGADRTAASVEDIVAGTGGPGAERIDVAIDGSGHPGAIRAALEALTPGGSLIIASLPDEEISLDISRHVVLREIQLRGIYGRLIDETWLAVERLLSAGAIDVEPILTHSFPLEDFERAFDIAASGQAGKVMFDLSD